MSNLESKVMDALKDAMKAKDDAKLRTLRAIKSAILLEKTSGNTAEFDTDAELKMLNKLAKQRRDSLEIFEKENRTDLAAKEREELEIIQTFLPAQLSEAELQQEVAAVIAETGAASMAEMGKVMGVASKKLMGKADGKAISEMVKKLLS